MTPNDTRSHVLIVEDSPTQALQLRAFLEAQNLRVTHALTAETALERLNSELPDLVISDYHLPGMNGDELARQIRSNIRTRTLPILMLTQDVGRDSEQQGLESGADAYIPKTSDRELLLLRIQALLRQQSGRTQEPGRLPRFRRGRLLTVQASDALGHRISALLAEDGYAVTAASSLKAAENAVAHGGVDCVLVNMTEGRTDMTEGHLDGFAVCRALDLHRAQRPPDEIEAGNFQIVAILDRVDDRDSVAKTYAAGADDILPLNADDALFKLRVRALVRRKLVQEENSKIDRDLRENEIALATAAAKAAAAEASRMAELLEGERRFRTIFDTGYQLIWLLTTDGKVIVANRTAQETTRNTAADISGRTLWSTAWWSASPAAAAALKEQFSKAIETELARFEAHLKDSDGRARIFDVTLRAALNAEGRVHQVVVEAHDVTEFKQTEAALRQSQKMEAIGQITGGVAHDFNNLLMAILANLELLRKRLPNEDPAIDRFVEGAVQGAKRGVSLTQRLLAFARKQDLKSEPVDIAKLLRNMESLLERSVGPAIRFHWNVARDMSPAKADHNQLELAILNLAVNARDAMPSGGQIAIEAQESNIDVMKDELMPGRYVCVRIVDNGMGMDQETAHRAIEPFFSTKETGKGTGLGLSMVHGMAMQLGGALRLVSEIGTGTTAELWLPVSHAPTAPAPVTTAPLIDIQPRSHAATILVVDDDALISQSIVDMLEEAGFSVIETNAPQDALEILRSDAVIDLVVTDYAMPFMTGSDLAIETRKLRPGLPILLATGYADIPPGTQIDLPRISKPYDQIQLTSQIANLLHSAEKN